MTTGFNGILLTTVFAIILAVCIDRDSILENIKGTIFRPFNCKRSIILFEKLTTCF